MSEVFSLRIKKQVVGNQFPFDRIYLVKHGEHACFKDLFRYALVMPVESELKSLLVQYALPDQYENRTFDRNDEELEQEKLSQEDWTKFLNTGNWVMAVPILTRYMKETMPRYLASAEWYRERHRRRRHGRGERIADRPTPMPGLTYLQTPTKNIRPVCVACPRFIMHQNGECHLGQPVCYESLALGLFDYFKEGLDQPLPEANVTEPEIEEFIAHGNLPVD